MTVGYAVAMATGARTCKCGKKLYANNKSGMCVKCYDKSPERREADRKWRSDNRDRLNAANREHYAANRERYSSQGKKHYQAHREQEVSRALAWVAANPDKAHANRAARRARRAGAFVEKVYRSVLWRRDGGICHLCLQPADPANWDLDHVISLLEGGPHCYANAAVAHPSCNKEKGGSSRSSSGVRWAEATAAYKSFHDKEYG